MTTNSSYTRIEAIAYDLESDHLYYFQTSPNGALLVVDALSGALLSEFALPVQDFRSVRQIVVGSNSILLTEDGGRTL